MDHAVIQARLAGECALWKMRKQVAATRFRDLRSVASEDELSFAAYAHAAASKLAERLPPTTACENEIAAFASAAEFTMRPLHRDFSGASMRDVYSLDDLPFTRKRLREDDQVEGDRPAKEARTD